MVIINYWEVIVAAIAGIVLGFLWYGPFFGKQWMALSGITKEQMEAGKAKGMAKSYVLMAIGSLVTAYVLAYVFFVSSAYLAVTGLLGAAAGLAVGAMCWVGFIAPVLLNQVLWENKSWKLWFLNSGYHLVALLIMGLIFAWM